MFDINSAILDFYPQLVALQRSHHAIFVLLFARHASYYLYFSFLLFAFYFSFLVEQKSRLLAATEKHFYFILLSMHGVHDGAYVCTARSYIIVYLFDGSSQTEGALIRKTLSLSLFLENA